MGYFLSNLSTRKLKPSVQSRPDSGTRLGRETWPTLTVTFVKLRTVRLIDLFNW